MRYTALIGEKTYELEIGAESRILIDGVPHQVDFQQINGKMLYTLLVDNSSWEVLVEHDHDEYRLLIEGELLVVTVQDERTRKIEKGLGKAQVQSGEVTLKAPMPGLVRGVHAQAGQEVRSGQGLVILEAMKMENELRAPKAGTVKDVRVKSGDKVDQGQPLLTIK